MTPMKPDPNSGGMLVAGKRMGSWSCYLEGWFALNVPMSIGHYDDAGELYPCATARFGICADRVR
jgi:hypothetical protein